MRRFIRVAAISAAAVLLAATTLAASPRAEKSAAAARGYGPGTARHDGAAGTAA